MKTQRKIHFLVFLSMTLAPYLGAQQPVIYGLANEPARNSLIQMIDTVTGISYKYSGSIQSFNYLDLSNLTELRSPLPSGYMVEDFVIYDSNMVYFCGQNANTGRAFFGETRLSFLTNGAGMFRLYDVPALASGLNLRAFTKCDVYEFAGEIYLVTVGGSSSGSFIAEIRINSSGASVNAAITSTLAEIYDDITVTDRYVIVSGHDNLGSSQLLRAYEKVSIPGISMFAASVWQIQTSGLYSQLNTSGVKISFLGGDTIATAFYMNIIGNEGVLVSAYDCAYGTPTLIGSGWSPANIPSPTSVSVDDFTYKKNDRCFYLSTVEYPLKLVYKVGFSGGFSNTVIRYDMGSEVSVMLDRNRDIVPLVSTSVYTNPAENHYTKIYPGTTPDRCIHSLITIQIPISYVDTPLISLFTFNFFTPVVTPCYIDSSSYSLYYFCR